MQARGARGVGKVHCFGSRRVARPTTCRPRSTHCALNERVIGQWGHRQDTAVRSTGGNGRIGRQPGDHSTTRRGDTWATLRVFATPGTHVSERETTTVHTATLQRPLGLNLKEDGNRIVIESIEKNSNADKSGVFAQGDRLVACSAIMMATSEESSRGKLYNRNSRGKKGGCCSTGCPDCPFNHRNWERVMFDCRDKNFDTVIAALQSNSQARWLARGGADKEVTITISVERST